MFASSMKEENYLMSQTVIHNIVTWKRTIFIKRGIIIISCCHEWPSTSSCEVGAAEVLTSNSDKGKLEFHRRSVLTDTSNIWISKQENHISRILLNYLRGYIRTYHIIVVETSSALKKPRNGKGVLFNRSMWNGLSPVLKPVHNHLRTGK